MASGKQIYRVAMLMRSELERVRQVIGNQYLDCTFDYYDIDQLRDLRDTFLKIGGSYDGILTSGTFSDRYIACYSGENGVPHRAFSVSVENYYRQILLQTMHDPSLSLGDIRMDMMTEQDNLPDILEENRLGQLMRGEQMFINQLTPEQVADFEKEMVDRYLRSIQTKGCRLFMTHSSLARKQLQARGVQYVYVKLTTHEIFHTVEALRREMELKQLKDSQVASIRFDLGANCTVEQLERIRAALEEFGQAHSSSTLVFSESGNCFEALTDAQTIYVLTRDNTYSELSDYLLRKTALPVAVGYGIGTNVQDARENAITAAQYARSTLPRLNQTFLIGSNQQIIPLRTSLSPENTEPAPLRHNKIFEPAVNEIAQRSHLSSRTVITLMTALQKQYRRDVDSEWIIRELNVSIRMANKILARLESAGYAYISGKKLPSGKGRPSNIYTLRFDIGS